MQRPPPPHAGGRPVSPLLPHMHFCGAPPQQPPAQRFAHPADIWVQGRCSGPFPGQPQGPPSPHDMMWNMGKGMGAMGGGPARPVPSQASPPTAPTWPKASTPAPPHTDPRSPELVAQRMAAQGVPWRRPAEQEPDYWPAPGQGDANSEWRSYGSWGSRKRGKNRGGGWGGQGQGHGGSQGSASAGSWNRW